MGVELVAIIIFSLATLLNLLIVLKYLLPLTDNDLENKHVFMQNVIAYLAELKGFYIAVVLSVIFLVLLFFVLYALSRTMIWNRILGVKNNYMRNMGIDAILYVAGAVILFLCASFIKPRFYLLVFLFTYFPLLYYSFFCHMNFNKKKVKDVFKSALSLDMLSLLPHTIIMAILYVLLQRNLITFILLFIIMNFFRIYAYEVKRVVSAKILDAE